MTSGMAQSTRLLTAFASLAVALTIFDGFLEYRRDWSNRSYFQTSQAGSPSDHQSTAAVGLVWWYGGKQGAW